MKAYASKATLSAYGSKVSARVLWQLPKRYDMQAHPWAVPDSLLDLRQKDLVGYSPNNKPPTQTKTAHTLRAFPRKYPRRGFINDKELLMSEQEIKSKINNLKEQIKDVHGTKCEVYSRVVGYLRPVQGWNKGKKEEFFQRKKFNICGCNH